MTFSNIHELATQAKFQVSFTSLEDQLSSAIEKGISNNEVERSLNILEKGGKKAVVGEKRTFGEREYIKTASGWKFHGKGTGKKAKAHVEAHEKPEKLSEKEDKKFFTNSGKSFKHSKENKDYSNWTKEDHEDAANFHGYKNSWGKRDERAIHAESESFHREKAKTAPTDNENNHYWVTTIDHADNIMEVSARGKSEKEAEKNARLGRISTSHKIESGSATLREKE